MKKLLLLTVLYLALNDVHADSTISSVTTNNSAYGANIGWVNFHGDTTNGAVIGDFICSGYAYGANVGWIHLGNGAPANQIRYSNSGTDVGVNHDGLGNLRGYAYGANIGWINFEAVGNPKANLQTGVLSGYAYGANVGWISLSNLVALVKTDSFHPGISSDRDQIPDAWELTYAVNLDVLTDTGDADGDGHSDTQEYLADTNPGDPNSNLRITAYSVDFSGVNNNDTHTVTYTSRPTRFYRFQVFNDITTPFFTTGKFPPGPGITSTDGVGIGGPAAKRFLRIEAVRPLVP